MQQHKIPGLQGEAVSQVRLCGVLQARLPWGVFSKILLVQEAGPQLQPGFQRLHVKELDDGVGRVCDSAGIAGLWGW